MTWQPVLIGALIGLSALVLYVAGVVAAVLILEWIYRPGGPLGLPDRPIPYSDPRQQPGQGWGRRQ